MRKGISEIIGAIIVTIIIFNSIIIASLLVERTKRFAAYLEEPVKENLAIYPYVQNGTLRVFLAPTIPGSEFNIMIIDRYGKIIKTLQVTINTTKTDIKILEEYNCTPVYIVIIDETRGLIYIYNNNELNYPSDPRLFKCKQYDYSIIDPITGKAVKIIPIKINKYNINFKKTNDSIKIIFNGYIMDEKTYNDYYHKYIFIKVRVKFQNNSYIGYLTGYEPLRFTLGKYNLTLKIIIDKSTNIPVIVARVKGYSDYYLVNLSESISLDTNKKRYIIFGHPNSTIGLLPMANYCNCFIKEIKYSVDRTGSYGYEYKIISKKYVKGLAITDGNLSIAYWITPNTHFSSILRVKLDIIGEYNVTVEPRNAVYLGEAYPGDVITISVESLLSRVTSKTWQHATARVLEEARNGELPLYLLMVSDDIKSSKYVRLHAGSNIIISDSHYYLYLGYNDLLFELGYLSSWMNLTISESRSYDEPTDFVARVTYLWNGTTLPAPPPIMSVPPYLVELNISDRISENYIINFVVFEDSGFSSYLAFDLAEWENYCVVLVPYVSEEPMTCYSYYDTNHYVGSPAYVVRYSDEYLKISIDNEIIHEVPLYTVYLIPAGQLPGKP